MTTFDAATGRLRTTAADFDALLTALADGADGPAPADDARARLDRLAALGVIGEDGPHEALRPALRDVLRPTGVVTLAVAGARSRLDHRAWFTPETATALLAVDPTLADLVRLPTPHLPSLLAAALHLGPRRRVPLLDPAGPGTPVRIAPDVLGALTSGEAGPVGEGVDLLRSAVAQTPGAAPAFGAAFDRDGWRVLALEASWPAGGAADADLVATSLVAIDTPVGYARVEPADDDSGDLVLRADSATGVFTDLVAVCTAALAGEVPGAPDGPTGPDGPGAATGPDAAPARVAPPAAPAAPA